MLYCRVHDLCECIHEIQRTLNYHRTGTVFLIGSTGIARVDARMLSGPLSPLRHRSSRGFSAVTDERSRTHRCPYDIFWYLGIGRPPSPGLHLAADTWVCELCDLSDDLSYVKTLYRFDDGFSKRSTE